MLKNDFLVKEVGTLQIEVKKKMSEKVKNKMFINFMIVLIPLLFISIYLNASESWNCDGCNQYVSSDNPDIWGDYYCNSCGTKK